MKLLLKFDSKTLKLFYEFITEIYKCKPIQANSILFNFNISNIFVMYSTLDDANEKNIDYNYIDYESTDPLILFEYMLILEDGSNYYTIKEYQVAVTGLDLNIKGSSLNTIKMSMKEFEKMKEYLSSLLGICQDLKIRVKSERLQDNKIKNLLLFEADLNVSAKRIASFEVRVRKIVYKMEYISIPCPKRIITAELNNVLLLFNTAEKFKAKCVLNKVDMKDLNIIIQTKLNFDRTLSIIFMFDTKTCEVIELDQTDDNFGWESNVDDAEMRNLYFKIKMNNFVDILSTKTIFSKVIILGFGINYLSVFIPKNLQKPNSSDYTLYLAYSTKLPAELLRKVKDVKHELEYNETVMKIDNSY